MKNALAATLLVSLAAGPAWGAQATSPPKALCLTLTGFADTYQLAVKGAGTVKNNEGAFRQSAISGMGFIGFNVSVVGAGNVAPGSTEFHANWHSVWGDGIPAHWELFLDLPSKTGVIHYTYVGSNSGQADVTAVDCRDLPVIAAGAAQLTGGTYTTSAK